MNLVEHERAKYAQLWSDVPEYREYSPGVENVQRFMDEMKPAPMSTILDIGCGTGVAGMMFAKFGLYPHWIDITDAGLHPDVKRNRFTKIPLWDDWSGMVDCDYGFCCDVMEHIPTEYTMLVIDRILSACRTTWFQISLVPDQFGATIGQPLHLTVKPFAWWLDRFKLAGQVIDARDLCGQALYVVRK
jgi:hypothetical protein